ncbi:fluoride efflux transporter CrcB [Albibacterium profundi]|uniref:Fluoride-specific ion channel FluC n=1 Tax=Albibacterium profundi TaxID=3134906 RepID=A0ABV5CBL2_9SPHI
MLKQILLVGLGGGIGSILRFLTSVVTQKYNSSLFPLATFAVNILGCFLIGLLIGSLSSSIQNNQNLRLLLITGFCGGYTTFSTFASENFSLLQNQYYGTAALYIGTSIIGGLIAVWLGLTLAK